MSTKYVLVCDRGFYTSPKTAPVVDIAKAFVFDKKAHALLAMSVKQRKGEQYRAEPLVQTKKESTASLPTAKAPKHTKVGSTPTESSVTMSKATLYVIESSKGFITKSGVQKGEFSKKLEEAKFYDSQLKASNMMKGWSKVNDWGTKCWVATISCEVSGRVEEIEAPEAPKKPATLRSTTTKKKTSAKKTKAKTKKRA